MKNIIILLFLFTTSLLIYSCNEDTCPLNTVSLAHFDFADAKNGKSITLTNPVNVTGFIIADVTLKDTLADGTIKETIVKDSVISDTLYNSATTSLSLPMSYTGKTNYVIHYNETMKDTIVVNYKVIPFLENIACGTLMFYYVNSFTYTNNVIDSVALTNPDIKNEEKRNFTIYYRTE